MRGSVRANPDVAIARRKTRVTALMAHPGYDTTRCLRRSDAGRAREPRAAAWTKYHGGEPLEWAKWFCTQKVNSAPEIKPLDFMIWNGHIAMIDWVWKLHDDKTVEVDICQSSAGGPQCNERVILQENGQTSAGHHKFKFHSRGTPVAPVDENFFIMRRKGFFY